LDYAAVNRLIGFITNVSIEDLFYTPLMKRRVSGHLKKLINTSLGAQKIASKE